MPVRAYPFLHHSFRPSKEAKLQIGGLTSGGPMDPKEALRRAYAQVAREFKFEADKIVRRKASRERLLQLFGSQQTQLGWSDDEVFDKVVNWRKQSKLPSLHEVLANEN